jgi:hypothetical protein
MLNGSSILVLTSAVLKMRVVDSSKSRESFIGAALLYDFTRTVIGRARAHDTPDEQD